MIEFDYPQYRIGQKRIRAIYSDYAQKTLWNILIPIYNCNDQVLKEKATAWHHNLRREIRNFMESDLIYTPTKIISSSVGYQTLGSIGGIEYLILRDILGERYILISQLYFSAAYLLAVSSLTLQNNATFAHQYRFYGNGGDGTSIVVRICRGKRLFNFVNSVNNILFKQDFKQVKQFQNGIAYGYGTNGRYYQLRLNGTCVEYPIESIRLSKTELCRLIESTVYHYCDTTGGLRKAQLNEKYYNPFRESMIDGELNGYDVLDGAKEKQIICDLPDKGWVEDIRMYSKMRTGGKTYCLYRRTDNGKYFFVEIYDDRRDEEHLHCKVMPKKSVPDFIMNDAVSLIRCKKMVRDILHTLQIYDLA